MQTSQRFVRTGDLPWEAVEPGVQRQILTFDATLMMVRVRFEAGAVGALHHHVHRQVSYVESGAFEVEIDGDRQLLRQGDSFLVPPEAVHGVVAIEPGSLVDVFSPAREDFLR